jgi:hypothetical protein
VARRRVRTSERKPGVIRVINLKVCTRGTYLPVVVALLVIMAGAFLPGCFGTTEPEQVVNEVEQQGSEVARQANLRAIDAAIQVYFSDNGEYPDNIDQLSDYMRRIPEDPLGGTYYLEKKGEEVSAAVK